MNPCKKSACPQTVTPNLLILCLGVIQKMNDGDHGSAETATNARLTRTLRPRLLRIAAIVAILLVTVSFSVAATSPTFTSDLSTTCGGLNEVCMAATDPSLNPCSPSNPPVPLLGMLSLLPGDEVTSISYGHDDLWNGSISPGPDLGRSRRACVVTRRPRRYTVTVDAVAFTSTRSPTSW